MSNKAADFSFNYNVEYSNTLDVVTGYKEESCFVFGEAASHVVWWNDGCNQPELLLVWETWFCPNLIRRRDYISLKSVKRWDCLLIIVIMIYVVRDSEHFNVVRSFITNCEQFVTSRDLVWDHFHSKYSCKINFTLVNREISGSQSGVHETIFRDREAPSKTLMQSLRKNFVINHSNQTWKIYYSKLAWRPSIPVLSVILCLIVIVFYFMPIAFVASTSAW